MGLVGLGGGETSPFAFRGLGDLGWPGPLALVDSLGFATDFPEGEVFPAGAGRGPEAGLGLTGLGLVDFAIGAGLADGLVPLVADFGAG